MNCFRSTLLSFAFLINLFGQSTVAADTVLNFDVSGWFSWLTNSGGCCAFDGQRHAITGTLQYNIDSGTGTLNIDPFINTGANTLFNVPISIEAIGDGAGGSGPLVLGNTLFEWSTNSNLPVSIVWDATGLLNYIGVGNFTVSDVVTGGALPESDNTVGPPSIGSSPLATTSWDTTALCTPGSCIGVNPSGALPLVIDTVIDGTNGDTGIGGSPMIDGSFVGFNVNVDLTSLTLTSVDITPVFINVAPSLGISGSGVSVNNGNGIAWIDYDNDGWDDLYIVSGSGADNKLYRNVIGTGFSLVSASGAELTAAQSTGVTIADFDDDGWNDIFVTNIGINTLLKNNSGDGTFTDVTTAMSLDVEFKHSYTAAFGDVDGDGDLDLYVGHWGAAGSFMGNDFYRNLLVENGGNADFIRTDLGITDEGHTFAVLMTDYDADGDLDLYSINDNLSSASDTKAFRNDGVNMSGAPVFVLEDSDVGLNFLINGMGIAAGDVNRDGLLDYHVSGFCPDNVVLTNDGGNQFSNTGPVTPSGVCWGAAFADVDNDGDSDLYVGNNNFNSSTGGPNFLFTNDGSGSFTQQSATGAEVYPGFGIAMSDYDRDGRVDFAVQDANGQIELLQNNTPNNGNHWLSIRLNGTESNKRGIGAKIRVTSTGPSGAITQLQEMHAGSSHGSTHSYASHFGFELGSTIDSIVINWPMGKTKTISSMALDQSVVISESPSFTDVTQAAGFSHTSASDPRVDTGGGVAWIDIDNDGFYDLYIPNPEVGNSWLYHNIDDGSGNRIFIEIGSLSGSDAHNSAFPSTGASVGDFDGDGCDDIYVTNGKNSDVAPFVGAQRNTLLINNFCSSGELTFTDSTVISGLGSELANSMVSSVGDIDKDGDLDIYVGNYLPNGDFAGAVGDFCDPNHLYLNNGGTFTEVGSQTGVDNLGCALGSAMTDFDNDGDLDIYVVNDFNRPGRGLNNFPDRFYINTGTVNGIGHPVFEVTDSSNVTNTPTSMGIAVGDYDNDGDLDYYTTAFTLENVAFSLVLFEGFEELNRLSLNDGSGAFTDQTVVANAGALGTLITSGLAADPGYSSNPSVWFNLASTGWGTAFFDSDNDGDLDLYVANGAVSPSAAEFTTYQPNRFLLNQGNGLFMDAGILPGPAQTHIRIDSTLGDPAVLNHFTGHDLTGQRNTADCLHSDTVFTLTGTIIPCYDYSRGAAVADYDNDGDMDVFVVNVSSGPRLFRNDANIDSNDNNWLELRLVGSTSNSRGIGAKVKVTSTSTAGTMTQLREINSGSSHGSTHAFTVHFGFPAGTAIDQVTIEWPMGTNQILTNVDPDQVMIITESDDTDGDGLLDVDEVNIYGTSPSNSDTDGDNLSDGFEINFDGNSGYNPYDPVTNPTGTDLNATSLDTDGDGYNDDVEIAGGSSPLDPLSTLPNGDINQDGTVNAADVLLATRHIMNLKTLNTDQIRQGDLYPPGGGDGDITTSDLILIQQLVLEMP